MALLIICIIILSFLTWVLISPIRLYINTDTKKYFIELKGIFRVSLVPDKKEIFFLRFRLFFINFNFFPFRTKKKKEKLVKHKKQRKKKRKKTGIKKIRLIIKYTWNVLKSFKLRRFNLNIDTDNVILNAFLIPVFIFINRKNIWLNVNYNGELSLILLVENRVINILLVMVRTFLKFKKK